MNQQRIGMRTPRRITATLASAVFEGLEARSLREGRSLSNLAAFLIEDALRHDNSEPLTTAPWPQSP